VRWDVVDTNRFVVTAPMLLGVLLLADLVCVVAWWWLAMVGRVTTLHPGPFVTIWSRRRAQRKQFGPAGLAWLRIQRPLVLRAAGAARLVARQPTSDSKSEEVMPAAPLAEALRVAERLVSDPALVTTPLTREPVITPSHLVVPRGGGGRDVIQREPETWVDLSWRLGRPDVITVKTPWGRVYRGQQQRALSLAAALCPVLLNDDDPHTEQASSMPQTTTPERDAPYIPDPTARLKGPEPDGEIDTDGPW
jgi:hypothetical protein